jgi:MYXO-CTERM domain-containing protein
MSTFAHFVLASLLASVCACSAATDGPGLEANRRVEQAVSGPFAWKGFTWTASTGGMAGEAPGDPANVVVDANGYLHMKITKAGSKWTAAEVFTTTSLGFGTYQWQIDGPVDRMDHTVVLGLYPYGPAAGIGGDGTNEIDTEFSFWNDEIGDVNVDWGVYPATTAGKHWEKDFRFSLNGGTATTARMEWSSTGVKSTLLTGFQPIGSNANVISTFDYVPTNPNVNIPQKALPLGMNLWCYKGMPSSGHDVEIVLRDFQFVPRGQTIPTPLVIAASAGKGGTITPSGDVSVNPGDSATFAITPAAKHVIDVVTVDGVSQGAIGSYTFSDVHAAHTIAAAFVEDTSANGDGGAGDPPDAATGATDAGVAHDAGKPSSGGADPNNREPAPLSGDSGGCACHAAGAPGERGSFGAFALASMGALVALALVRRARRATAPLAAALIATSTACSASDATPADADAAVAPDGATGAAKDSASDDASKPNDGSSVTPDAGSPAPDSATDDDASFTPDGGGAILVPAQGALLGHYYGHGTIAATDARIGRKPAIHLTYYGWNEDWTSDATPVNDFAAGKIPLVNWEPEGVNFDDIISGSLDPTIKARAAGSKALGKKFFLDFAAEMNGDEAWGGNNPTKYIAAYRHIHDIFTAAGANNVIWAWCPNVTDIENGPPTMDYYPGDTYVDWTGVDGYNWGTSQPDFGWQSFHDVFASIYAKLAAKGKPILIGEMASDEAGGDKGKWIDAIIPTLRADFPMIKAFVWFDIDKERHWQIDSSPGSLAAYSRMASDPFMNP